MNKQRRKKIDAIIEKLSCLLDEVEDVRQEEEEALDNMPESLQETERYEAMQTAVDNLDTVVSGIEEFIELLEEAKGE